MEYNSIDDLIEEIKVCLKNKEYAFAALKISEAQDSPFLTLKLKTNLKILKAEINKYLDPKKQKLLTLEDLFFKAFLLNDFFPDFFLNWVCRMFETKIFELTKKQLTILGNFFVNNQIANNYKFFVLSALYDLKLNITVSYLNNKLKTLDEINSLSLNRLASYTKYHQVNAEISDLCLQNPSMQNLVHSSWNTIVAYTFPMGINFPSSMLADYLTKYVQSKLERENTLVFIKQKNQQLVSFIRAILEESSSEQPDQINIKKHKS